MRTAPTAKTCRRMLVVFLLSYVKAFQNLSGALNSTESFTSTSNVSRNCSLLLTIPFGGGRDDTAVPRSDLRPGATAFSDKNFASDGYGLMAAAVLAVDHFNARDGTVVRELSTIQNCSFFFPRDLVQIMDSGRDSAVTYQGLRFAKQFCAAIGPMETVEAEVLRIALRADDIPGATYGSRIVFPSPAVQIVRVAIDPTVYVAALGRYLLREGKERNFIGLLTDETQYGSGLPGLFESVARPMGLSSKAATLGTAVNQMEGDQRMLDALVSIYESGVRTIVVGFGRDGLLHVLAKAADSLGMLSEEFLWIFLDITMPPEYIYEYNFATESALDRMLRGSAIFKLLDGFEWNAEDHFLPVWKSLNESFVERLNGLYPKATAYNFSGAPDYFQTERPPTAASFVYDAVILASIAQCLTNNLPPDGPPPGGPPTGNGLPPGNNSFTGGGPPPGYGPPPGNGPPLGYGPSPGDGSPQGSSPGEKGNYPQELVPLTGSSNAWIQRMLHTSFYGASGLVAIDSRNSRSVNNVGFGVFNIQPNGLASTSEVQYKAVLTDVMIDGEWQTTGKPFIFRDGTTNQPKPVRVINWNNYIPTAVRVTGLLFMAVAQVLSAICGVFAWVYRKDRIMMASQPEFLYLLCGGSFLFSSSILTRSFDEGVGLTVAQLDHLCMASPWLLFLGDTIIYLAIFSKLWRVQRVLQFRRGQQITIRHVIGPFVFFELTVLAIMTTWQVVSPWRWQRQVIESIPPQSIGRCTSEHDAIFMGLLSGILVVVTLLAGWMSWKTRDTPSDVSDSARVRFTILTHLQSIIVGVPIIYILNGKSPSALFLGFALLVSTISITSVSFLVVPKMYFILWERRNGSTLTSSRRNVRITGLAGTVETDYDTSSVRFGGSSTFNMAATHNGTSAEAGEAR